MTRKKARRRRLLFNRGKRLFPVLQRRLAVALAVLEEGFLLYSRALITCDKPALQFVVR